MSNRVGPAYTEDSYVRNNNLVEQGTLPSTVCLRTTLWNVALSNTYISTQTRLHLVIDAALLHLTQTGTQLGSRWPSLQFHSADLSGFETFGDNQFATPITFFPDLRNQQKYSSATT